VSAPQEAPDRNFPRLLVVAHSCPWPPTSGGKIDMYGRLRALRELGLAVDAIFTVKEEAAPRAQILKTDLGLGSCRIIPRRRSVWRSLHPTWPFQVASRQGPEWAAAARGIPPGTYHAVLAEGTYVLPMAAALAEEAGALLLHRLHNLESRYFFSLGRSESHPVRKVFYYLEGLRFRRLERRLFHTALHLCISTEECRILAAAYPGRAVWLPPALARFPEPPALPRPVAAPHFLLTGSLNLPDTWQGVRWFTERLWPGLDRDLPGAVLTIAGRRPEAAAVAYLNSLPGVRAVFDVPEMDPYFREADVFVSPILEGAGVKIKTVEALAYGLPVVATPVAAQGCGLVHEQHLLIARSEAEFLAACRRLARDAQLRRRLAAAGREYVRQAFDQRAHLQTLLTSLGLLP